ncbi:MAG TPA: nuclear transport factor 2 family protein [Anaerolineae bacterium]
MNTKRILFALLIAVAGLAAACSSATPAPTPQSATSTVEVQAATSTVEAPTAAPTAPPAPPSPDPISIVQSFWDALIAKDVDAAVALLADDARWEGVPTTSGKDNIRVLLQVDIDAGVTYEVSDFRATRGRVTYFWSAYQNGVMQTSGEDVAVVDNGKITAFESYAFLGDDARPPIAEAAFTASDSAFSGPDEIAGSWVKIALTNEGQEPHHIQLVKLEEGKTPDDLKTALTSDAENYPAWAVPYGGPNAPDPGGSASAIVYLEAGFYALIDIIPNAEGVPHFQSGLLKGLTVTQAPKIMPGEPKPGVTVDLADFSFTLSGSPAAGEQMIRFRNAGSQVHEAFLVKLADGKTAEDYLNTPPGAIPPGVSLGGITGIAPGDGQYIEVTLEPGTYALFCFLPDPGTHAPHFVQGMIQEFTIE